MNIPTLDEKLLRKYDVSTPSYTSYPRTTQFHQSFDENQYEQHAERSNANLLPKSLSLYIHIPFRGSLCCFGGNNSPITRKGKHEIEDYIERLTTEIVMRGRRFDDGRLVTKIQFGGAPNVLRPYQLGEILESVATRFHLDLPRNLDIGIEIDPHLISPLEIEELTAIGLGRFNIRVQDFSNTILTASSQHQSESNTLVCIAEALRLSKSVYVELITGLPEQTPESFEQTLRGIIDMGVTRIGTHSFSFSSKQKVARRLSDKPSLSTQEARLFTTQLARNILLNAGYYYIGNGHYTFSEDGLAKAQLDKPLHRVFQDYTKHKDTDLVGIGVSAISKFDTAYSQNTNTLSIYNEMIDNRTLPIAKGIALTQDDRLRAVVIEKIMSNTTIDLSQRVSDFVERKNDMRLLEYFKEELNSLYEFVNDELVNPTRIGFDITELGRYFIHSIASVFDRSLRAKENSHVMHFSKPV